MREAKVMLNSVELVKEFNAICMNYNCDIDVSSSNKRCPVDGKSLLGLFALDRSKLVTVSVNGEPEEENKFLAEIKKFEV